jgi:HAMP domain-containing protein/ABC-type transporter Mla subunit MlaD
MMYTINHRLADVLRGEWAVPIILGAMLAGCLLILLTNYVRHYRGITRGLKNRLAILRPIEKNEDADDARQAFQVSFPAIDAAMRARDGCVPLAHAWLEFSETFFEPGTGVIKSTDRPDGYFLHLGDNTRVLAWWANIYIALGLTATFLGIIAALTVTTDGLRNAGASATGMSSALTALLGLTAVKFWTSIGGVGVSIVLRLFDRGWHTQSVKRLERVAHVLEKGTLYVPPQQIAAAQLHELKEHSTALREFTTQLAVGIADALQEKLAPVVVGLGNIQSSINDFKNGSFDQIGKELGDALSKSTGSEMAGLAAALTAMTDGVKGVNDKLEGASAQASDQIAVAAKEFSSASEQMTRAFASLNEKLEGASTRAAEQMDGTMRSALDGFTSASTNIHAAFDQIRGQIAELGQAMTSRAGDVADRNANILAKAASALESATGRATEGMNQAIDAAITRSAEESGRALTSAFAAFGERFDAASSGLVETLRTTAGRMETLAGAIERSTGAANDHADKLAGAGREAQSVAQMLGRAANDVSAASAPIRDAVAHSRESIGQGNQALTRLGEESARSAEKLQTVANSLEQTSQSADSAWKGYHNRFGEVDESLGRALDHIQKASTEHATQLNAHVGRLDGALAQAVDRLAQAIEPLTELSNELGDVLQKLRGPQ